jgi:hypothetical protein
MSKLFACIAATVFVLAVSLPTSASAAGKRSAHMRGHHAGLHGHHHRHHWRHHRVDCGCNAGWHVPWIDRDAPPFPFVLVPGPWWFAS